MSFRKTTFENGEIYHIVLRSVEGIKIIRDVSDYFRIIFGLYEFNNKKPVSIWQRRRNKKQQTNSLKMVQGQALHHFEREVLVEIFAFCIMPNHIHLLLRQTKEGGITRFLQKLGTGYAMYFNKKYNRMGHLFQGSFRAVRIKNDKQLQTVFVYIHTNPVSLIVPKWKEKGIDNIEKVIKFLESYKWSSYLDYIGKKNFPSITERNFLLEVIGGIKESKKFVKDWLTQKKKLKNLISFEKFEAE